MATNTIIIKNSSTASSIPLIGDLELGELAINTTDGKLYCKKGDNTIVDLSEGDLVADLTPQLGGNLDTNNFHIITPDAVDANHIAITAGASSGQVGGNIEITSGNSEGNAGNIILATGAGSTKNLIAGEIEFIFQGANNGILFYTLINDVRMQVNTTAGVGDFYIETESCPDGPGPNVTIEAGDSLQSNGVGGNLVLLGGSAPIDVGTGGNVIITGGDGDGTSIGDVVIQNQIFPSAAGTNGYVLTTNGTDMSWAAGGISNIIDDTTPQLGANLDVNGFDIVTADNGVGVTNDINITPGTSTGEEAGYINITAGGAAGVGGFPGIVNISGGSTTGSEDGGDVILSSGQSTGGGVTGVITLDGQKFPNAAGTNGYVLTTDGTDMSWAAAASGDLVDDLSPQLGANLDTNNFHIITADAVAPNTISITAGTASGATSANVEISAGGTSYSGGTGGRLTLVGGSAYTGTTTGGEVLITGGAGTVVGDVKIQNQIFPPAAGTNGYVLTTDGTDMSWATGDLVAESTPQLGANLDVNDFILIGKPAATVTSAGGSINITGAPGGATSGNGGDIVLNAGAVTSGTVGVINLNGVAIAKSFTLASLPPQVAGGMIYVSDATGSSLTGSQCFSNGTVWIDVTTGAAVV